MNTQIRAASSAAVVAFVASTVLGAPTIGFETYDDTSALENGRRLSTATGLYERGLFTISSTGDRATIFDSSDPGPNDSGGDGDLLVNLGNVVMIQNAGLSSITGGIYDTPDDAAGGGTVSFDFTPANGVYLDTIDLVDIDGSAATDVILTDINGLTRTYDVPSNWTNDIESQGPDGFVTLDLRTLLDQPGESSGGDATASQDAGFDETQVVGLDVVFSGSGALDNLVFVPTPGAAGLAMAGLAVGGIRRRR